MNILHIANPGISGINGVTNAVMELANSQVKFGCNVIVGLISENDCIKGDNVVEIQTMKKIKSLLNTFNPDIVVFHSLYNIKYIPFSALLRIKKIPYAIVFHGGASINNYQKNKLKKFVANLLLFNRFIRNAKRVIYLNHGELDNSIFTKINKSYSIIPNGISKVTPERKIMPKIVNISFISRMEIYGKGLDVLKESIKSLYKSGWQDKVKFEFYGFSYDDSHKIFDDFKSFAKYNGVVYGADKAMAFNNANIIILPSRSEGMPLTILEAFAYGCPCIVTPQTNMADVVVREDVGWVTALDEDSLTACIKQAYYDYLKDYQGYYERSVALSRKFMWDNVAQYSIEEYKKVL